MVRLKVDAICNYVMAELFQFLYGAIKSDPFALMLLNSKSFQFLYGAIKRKDARWAIWAVVYFNSSMVRLKGNTGIYYASAT